jgi:hypothetical protein
MMIEGSGSIPLASGFGSATLKNSLSSIELRSRKFSKYWIFIGSLRFSERRIQIGKNNGSPDTSALLFADLSLF